MKRVCKPMSTTVGIYSDKKVDATNMNTAIIETLAQKDNVATISCGGFVGWEKLVCYCEQSER